MPFVIRLKTEGSIRQPEDGQDTAELRVVGERLVGTHRAEAVGVLRETGCHADAGPSADAGENGDVLLAAMLIGHDVADDAGRRLEAIKLLAGRRIDGLEV